MKPPERREPGLCPNYAQDSAEARFKIPFLLLLLSTWYITLILLGSFFSKETGAQPLFQKSVSYGEIQAVDNHKHHCSPCFDTKRSERAAGTPGMIPDPSINVSLHMKISFWNSLF